MKLRSGAVLSGLSQVGMGRWTYVLLYRQNDKQWRVLVLESDEMFEDPGETVVINNGWLSKYGREIGA